MGLQLLNASTSKEACRAACCADPACEVWQFSTKRSDQRGELMSCYTGKGFECRSVRADDFLVYAGQRISHGTKLNPGWWCSGNGMHKTEYSSRLSHHDKMERCRNACFFDTSCTHWQYSTVKGCWTGSHNDGPLHCQQDTKHGDAVMDAQIFDGSCAGAGGDLGTNFIMVFFILVAAALLLIGFSLCILGLGLCRPKKVLMEPRVDKSSWRQDDKDDWANDESLEESGSRPGSPKSPKRGSPAAYRALYRSSEEGTPSASPNPSLSMSRDGSILSPRGGGGSMPRPADNSFGNMSVTSSNTSFGQGTTPLLPQQPQQYLSAPTQQYPSQQSYLSGPYAGAASPYLPEWSGYR